MDPPDGEVVFRVRVVGAVRAKPRACYPSGWGLRLRCILAGRPNPMAPSLPQSEHPKGGRTGFIDNSGQSSSAMLHEGRVAAYLDPTCARRAPSAQVAAADARHRPPRPPRSEAPRAASRPAPLALADNMAGSRRRAPPNCRSTLLAAG